MTDAQPAPQPAPAPNQLEQTLKALTYHRVEDEVQEVMADIREMFKSIARKIDSAAHHGRDKALAFTKLEDAAQAAIGAVARTQGTPQTN